MRSFYPEDFEILLNSNFLQSQIWQISRAVWSHLFGLQVELSKSGLFSSFSGSESESSQSSLVLFTSSTLTIAVVNESMSDERNCCSTVRISATQIHFLETHSNVLLMRLSCSRSFEVFDIHQRQYGDFYNSAAI